MPLGRLLAYFGYEMGTPIIGRTEAVNRPGDEADGRAPKKQAPKPKAERPTRRAPKTESRRTRAERAQGRGAYPSKRPCRSPRGIPGPSEVTDSEGLRISGASSSRPRTGILSAAEFTARRSAGRADGSARCIGRGAASADCDRSARSQ